MADQHIYHHNDTDGARVNVSAERNTKGWNYSATVVSAKTPAEAIQLLAETLAHLEAELHERPLNA